MERYAVFMDKKTQYCQNISSANLIYRFNSILIKIPASYFEAVDKLILKFIWRVKRPRIVNIILKKNKFWRLKLSGFDSYHETIVMWWYWRKNRQIDQRHKEPRYIINWSLTREQFNGEMTVFSANGTGTTGHPHAKNESICKKRSFIDRNVL